jgi:hypothetical protein
LEYRRGDDQAYSGLMLAARITLPHFSVSSAKSLPKSAGEPDNARTTHSGVGKRGVDLLFD